MSLAEVVNKLKEAVDKLNELNKPISEFVPLTGTDSFSEFVVQVIDEIDEAQKKEREWTSQFAKLEDQEIKDAIIKEDPIETFMKLTALIKKNLIKFDETKERTKTQTAQCSAKTEQEQLFITHMNKNTGLDIKSIDDLKTKIKHNFLSQNAWDTTRSRLKKAGICQAEYDAVKQSPHSEKLIELLKCIKKTITEQRAILEQIKLY
jgi:flagellar hook-basal body complex protein FliE